MKLKRFEVLDVCKVIDSFVDMKENKIFLYYLAKIRKALDSERELIIETGKPNEKYAEYELKKRDIVNLHCEKDETGQLIKINNNFKILEGQQDIVKAKLKELYESYKEEIENRKKELEKYLKFLDEEIDVETAIPLSSFPEILKKEDMDILSLITYDDRG